ncbi:uncharacterized protein LOC111203058 [Brassica napus]|uniref:uncharacterized protein LOC111203058 n=1 Tax=Brassica napus TaxID=3708 RepID=UPI000BBE14B3|nr:uncharacterized protein LOC111203058 [Brassica napus]
MYPSDPFFGSIWTAALAGSSTTYAIQDGLVGTSIKSWDSKFPQAEFSHNHAVNRSTRFIPFQIVYSLVPLAPTDLSTLPDRQCLHGDAETFMEQLVETHAQTKANLETVVSKYKIAADAHRRRLAFDGGDLVWVVLTRDCMPAHAYNKLKAKKIGPVEVLEHINDNAYRLRLPSDITTSDVFNVKYLSRYFPPDVP